MHGAATSPLVTSVRVPRRSQEADSSAEQGRRRLVRSRLPDDCGTLIRPVSDVPGECVTAARRAARRLGLLRARAGRLRFGWLGSLTRRPPAKYSPQPKDQALLNRARTRPGTRSVGCSNADPRSGALLEGLSQGYRGDEYSEDCWRPKGGAMGAGRSGNWRTSGGQAWCGAESRSPVLQPARLTLVVLQSTAAPSNASASAYQLPQVIHWQDALIGRRAGHQVQLPFEQSRRTSLIIIRWRPGQHVLRFVPAPRPRSALGSATWCSRSPTSRCQ